MESLLRLVAPMLDLVLATGERVSRLVGGDDVGYYPVVASGEAFELPPVRGRVEPEADDSA